MIFATHDRNYPPSHVGIMIMFFKHIFLHLPFVRGNTGKLRLAWCQKEMEAKVGQTLQFMLLLLTIHPFIHPIHLSIQLVTHSFVNI